MRKSDLSRTLCRIDKREFPRRFLKLELDKMTADILKQSEAIMHRCT